MNTIEVARTFAAHQQVADAQRAYTLVLQFADGTAPEEELEAACYLFDSGGDYRVAYTYFKSLYNRGLFQNELFDLMVGAFYAPNVKLQEQAYQRSCKHLSRYPYLFRQDFLPFDELPIKFFPFDDNGFLPFYPQENRFGEYINFDEEIISRNFFRDLENPILAEDLFSKYELEYLNDNVRKSEWVARENHIYLHYTDWTVFCAYLQVLDLRELLKDKKFVFLIEKERALYPIDFKERFDIDYSQYTLKPVGIREVKKLIWHTQLATHNGGDFFNEIFDGHPNLLANQSLMFDNIEETVKESKENVLRMSRIKGTTQVESSELELRVVHQLYRLKDVTEKDAFVALFLGSEKLNRCVDWNSRIAPAIFFQPHFSNMVFALTFDKNDRAVLNSQQYRSIQSSPIFRGFKYVKTFTPMRRITTSYAASVKFMIEYRPKDDPDRVGLVDNAICTRLLNRSFMINWQDKLYKDSTLVRFEDGKLNPTATFTALAAFLDIPYTPSLTRCTSPEGENPESLPGNALGFDPATIYRTYDDFANDTERYFLEYFMRDAYEHYGYAFQYYDGKPMDEERAKELIADFTTLNGWIRETFTRHVKRTLEKKEKLDEFDQAQVGQSLDKQIEAFDEQRLHLAKALMRGLYFINENGQPLKMMPPLKLDPELLEQPLYH